MTTTETIDGKLIFGFVAVCALVFLSGTAKSLLKCCCGCIPCCRPCRRRCFGDDAPVVQHRSVDVDGDEVSVDYLRKRKEVLTAYLLLMIGWTGAHHFYLDRLVHGMFALWSLNFFGLGWLIDAILMPLYVRGANRGISPVASSDYSACHLIFRLPLVLIVGLGGIYAGLFYVPAAIDAMGFIDLEVRGANMTARNPYDVLQAPRGASHDLAKKLYEAKVKTVKTQYAGNCNEECELELEETKKAFDYVSGKTWRRTAEEARARRKERKGKHQKRGHHQEGDTGMPDPWDDFVDKTLHDWRVILTDGLTSLRDKVVPEEEPNQSSEDSDDGEFGAGDNEEL